MSLTALLLTAITLLIYVVYSYKIGKKEVEKGGINSGIDYLFAFVVAPAFYCFLTLFSTGLMVFVTIGLYKFWMFVLP